MPIHQDIQTYNKSQSAGDKRICDALAKAIDQNLPGAESKIWHAHPVWFLDGNPIVGYSKLKDCIRLLFWSGQSFNESGLKPEGSFQAAEARFTSAGQINLGELKQWLKKSGEIQWDYKNIVKRKGKLVRLATDTQRKTTGSVASPTEKIDWRDEMLQRIRKLIEGAVPDAVEEVKWRKPSNGMKGVPVWSHQGIICTGETYKSIVKLTFPKGAAIQDPAGLFNASLEGNTRRAMDIHEGEQFSERAFQSLVRAAAKLNSASKSAPRTKGTPRKSRRA